MSPNPFRDGRPTITSALDGTGHLADAQGQYGNERGQITSSFLRFEIHPLREPGRAGLRW
jgi:hypothetical protein